MLVMNSVSMRDVIGNWGTEEFAPFSTSAGQEDMLKVSVNQKGFHVSQDGSVRHVFAHRQAWSCEAFERVEVDFAMGKFADVTELNADAAAIGNFELCIMHARAHAVVSTGDHPDRYKMV